MSFNNDFNFTPIHPRYNNDLFNEKKTNLNPNYNINLNNYFNYNPQNENNYRNTFNYNNTINENIYNPCYILISKFDNYTKELLNNFIYQQGISPRDVKNIKNDKIIIKFQNQRNRNEFINAYNKVKEHFNGIEIRFIEENEKDNIINNNANGIVRNITYNNDYMNNENNMIQLPQNKSNFQKFLDVFLNL